MKNKKFFLVFIISLFFIIFGFGEIVGNYSVKKTIYLRNLVYAPSESNPYIIEDTVVVLYNPTSENVHYVIRSSNGHVGGWFTLPAKSSEYHSLSERHSSSQDEFFWGIMGEKYSNSQNQENIYKEDVYNFVDEWPFFGSFTIKTDSPELIAQVYRGGKFLVGEKLYDNVYYSFNGGNRIFTFLVSDPRIYGIPVISVYDNYYVDLESVIISDEGFENVFVIPWVDTWTTGGADVGWKLYMELSSSFGSKLVNIYLKLKPELMGNEEYESNYFKLNDSPVIVGGAHASPKFVCLSDAINKTPFKCAWRQSGSSCAFGGIFQVVLKDAVTGDEISADSLNVVFHLTSQRWFKNGTCGCNRNKLNVLGDFLAPYSK